MSDPRRPGRFGDRSRSEEPAGKAGKALPRSVDGRDPGIDVPYPIPSARRRPPITHLDDCDVYAGGAYPVTVSCGERLRVSARLKARVDTVSGEVTFFVHPSDLALLTDDGIAELNEQIQARESDTRHS